MPQPTKTWICDVCGQLIVDISHGVVEWLQTSTTPIGPSQIFHILRRDIRIAHRWYSPRKSGTCQYYDAMPPNNLWGVGDWTIEEWSGKKGKKFIQDKIKEGFMNAEDLKEILRRIHVNGYEAARPHFEAAISARVICRRSDKDFYTEREIDAVLKFAHDLRAESRSRASRR